MPCNFVGPPVRGADCYGREAFVDLVWEKLSFGHVLLASPPALRQNQRDVPAHRRAALGLPIGALRPRTLPGTRRPADRLGGATLARRCPLEDCVRAQLRAEESVAGLSRQRGGDRTPQVETQAQGTDPAALANQRRRAVRCDRPHAGNKGSVPFRRICRDDRRDGPPRCAP
jgi:hypothetical protein